MSDKIVENLGTEATKLISKSNTKNLMQFALIYLFVFMTSFDSHKLKGTKFHELMESPFSHFLIIFGVYYSMNGGLLISSLVALILTALFVMFQVVEFMDLKLIAERTSVDPKCRGVKALDILKFFDEDVEKMRVAFKNSSIPEDSILNDLTAPEIATYLLYAGYAIC